MSFKTKLFNLIRLIFKIPLFEKMIRKLVMNKSSNSLIAKLVPNNYQYKKGSVRRFNFKGVHLEADIRDYVGHYLYFEYKDEGQEKLLELCETANTVLDIGTNIGSTLLLFAQKIGDQGQVFGFEPDKDNYNACVSNIELNSFENILVENIGLGDEEGEFNLVVDTETNRGGNRITTNEEIALGSKIKVKKLSSWIKTQNISQIDLVKIDVEGYEYKVLQGGFEVIEKYRPILFIELDDANLRAVGDNAEKLVELLQKLNYKVYHSITGTEILKSDDFKNCHFDIIAKPL